MRTLACLAALVLAAGPAAAAPILIDDLATTGLLPVEPLETDARRAAIEADGTGLDRTILTPVDRFVLVLHQTPIGGWDPGVVQATEFDGWNTYRSDVTGELLHVEDDFAVSRYSLEPAGSPYHFAMRVGVAADASNAANPSAPSHVAARRGRRDVQRAAVSNAQPAALTLAGVCMALAFSGGREWYRRNWYRRYMRRRR